MTTSATTITSLLDSLHTHLQSQTQQLPALHHQLGLPQTALADDLSTLQKQLAECVESQIEHRRKQVDEWMGRCDGMERECLRYSKALGGHIKATGSSVGEVRKEQVLPKRFEMISEYQEKLRQLYHTKLEQLTTLTNRIAALARTLGSDYFPPDILESIPASGEDDIESDIRRDVTPERFSRLEKELVRGKGEVGKRLHHLSLTLVQIDWLYSELGMAPPTSDEPFLSSSNHLSRPPSSDGFASSSSSITSDPFLSALHLATPTPSGMRSKAPTPFLLSIPSSAMHSEPSPRDRESEHLAVFTRFIARLDELSEEELTDPNKPSVGLEGVDPTPELLHWAEATQAALEDVKRKRESHIQAMYDQLESLWRRLGVSDAEMDAFVESHRGSTEVTITAYEEELDRMLELKREKMSTFIENARTEIRQLWDELMVGEEEQADFAPFADDEHSEDLLAIHEEEIRRLKEERKLKGPLLKSIQKYFAICEDQKELAAAAADQTRLLGRGPRDPGRLLREEKMRKRVTKEKPKLEQDLLKAIPAWEAETGRVFQVHGQSILQSLTEATQAQEKEKENGTKRGKTRSASAAAAAAPPPPARSKTPSYAPTSSTSSNKHGNVGPNRPSSSMSQSRTRSVSASTSRRPRLGEATSTHANNQASSSAVPPPLPVPLIPATAPRPRPPSPSGLRIPSSSNGKAPMTQPTPQTRATSTKRATPMSTGRVGSAQRTRTRSYHPYSTSQRTAPRQAQPPAVRVYGAVGLNSGSSAATARKAPASRQRRESFKPRPSIDDDWAGAGGGGDRRFAGFAGGTVAEVDEGEYGEFGSL